MIGKLLSSAVKVVTCPVDIAEASIDVLAGGDGSKRSRQDGINPMSAVRDGVCKALEDLDE